MFAGSVSKRSETSKKKNENKNNKNEILFFQFSEKKKPTSRVTRTSCDSSIEHFNGKLWKKKMNQSKLPDKKAKENND